MNNCALLLEPSNPNCPLPSSKDLWTRFTSVPNDGCYCRVDDYKRAELEVVIKCNDSVGVHSQPTS